MPRNKQRILLALYARPKYPNSPHYALLLTPKIKRWTKKQPIAATKYQVKHIVTMINGQPDIPWRKDIAYIGDINRDQDLLVCGVIAKVLDPVRTEILLHQTPVYQVDDPDEDKARSFDNVEFVKDAVRRVRDAGAVTWTDWSKAEEDLLAYMRKYREQGRWSSSGHRGSVPIIDLMTGKELRK